MKNRNVFLRTATWLLLANMALSGIFLGTVTFAKYVAVADMTSNARVARFDIVEANKTYSYNSSKTWGTALSVPAFNSYTGVTRVSNTGSVAFDLPLFDYQYITTAVANPAGYPVTVDANNRTTGTNAWDLIVAPGTGSFGAPRWNTNRTQSTPYNDLVFVIANRSEVNVRFKIEYVGSSPMDVVNGKKPPFFIRAMGGSATSATNTSWFRTDLVTTGFRNIFTNGAGALAMATDPTTTTNGTTNPSYSNYISSDGWFYLKAGQQTGTGSGTANVVPNVGIQWGWLFANNISMPTVNGTTYGESHNGYVEWGNSAVSPTWTGADGSYASTYLAYLGTGAAGNIDRYDTVWGLLAAYNGKQEFKLQFRITVEQVD